MKTETYFKKYHKIYGVDLVPTDSTMKAVEKITFTDLEEAKKWVSNNPFEFGKGGRALLTKHEVHHC